ncbi:MAG TPA: tetratricopeptide repeat protein [Verrucomicrobiae bacterium]|nr:tetratricopeptide repeat protein [Verrucomicrobiae bacterium]
MRSAGSTHETAPLFLRASRRLLLFSLLAVSVVSLWLFRPVLANGFVNWDDQGYIEQLVRMGRFSLSSLRWMWTSLQPFYLQPIAWMTHLADYQLWGLNPVGHHATNWLLHGVYVLLVGILVWMLTDKAGNLHSEERLGLSTFVALVCGIHPLQVESVAWVSARNGLLCSVWMVATLCVYLQAVGGDEIRRRWWWAAVALQLVALLTKPFAVSLPLLMLAIDFFPLQRHKQRGWWRLLREKWLLFILSALAAVGAIGSQEHLEGLAGERLSARLLDATRGFVFYLWKLIWPAWLSPFYPLQSKISLPSIEFLVPLVICILVTVVVVWQRQRAPLLAAAWWSYIVILLLVSGLLQVGGQAVADRYAYLAMVPPLIVLTCGLGWLWRHNGIMLRILIGTMLGVWLVFLGLNTRKQIPVWRDGVSLWTAVLTHFPNDPRANFNLAMALVGEGRLSAARPYAECAVNFSDPHAPQLPMARAALGTIDLKTHAYGAAVDQLRQAIASDDQLFAARYNLACAYARLGDLAEAMEVLRQLLATRPEYAALAARDSELAALRNDPRYAARFAELVGTTKGDGKF